MKQSALTMDHLVFAAPTLDEGVEYVEQLFGVETSPGGQHLGVGTCNRLIGFGPDQYMEVVSIDPDQPRPDRERWFGLDELDAPRLVTWCAKGRDLADLVGRAKAVGLDLGPVASGGRVRPDGSELTWNVTDPWAERAGGVIPFFIDWGTSEHPGDRLPATCSFVEVRVEHPHPDPIKEWLRALGLDTRVREGHAARVVATIDTPNGRVELT